MDRIDPISRPELFNRLRREFARYQFSVDAEIEWRSRTTWGRVTDISRSGMFIETDQRFPQGASFIVRLALNSPLELSCTVRRMVADRGVGVSLAVKKEERRRFESLLLALAGAAGPTMTGVRLPEPKRPRAAAMAAGR